MENLKLAPPWISNLMRGTPCLEILNPSSPSDSDVDDIVKRYRTIGHSQAAAVAHVLQNKLTLVQDPAGSGKTQTLEIIVREYDLRNTAAGTSPPMSTSKPQQRGIGMDKGLKVGIPTQIKQVLIIVSTNACADHILTRLDQYRIISLRSHIRT